MLFKDFPDGECQPIFFDYPFTLHINFNLLTFVLACYNFTTCNFYYKFFTINTTCKKVLPQDDVEFLGIMLKSIIHSNSWILELLIF